LNAYNHPEHFDLAAHPAYSRVFAPERLTFGLLAPLEGYPDRPVPTLRDHQALVMEADKAGFSIIWLRDVPFLDCGFGDVGQVFDPFVYAGLLAGVTQRIALGTAGVVLPLRDPLTVAKQAASVDVLLEGRFLLGLSTGDRPGEYPAFGRSFADRGERYRDAYAMLRAATEHAYATHRSTYYGELDGSLDLLPKPYRKRLPTLAIGRCQQDIGWIATHMDGWIWHQRDFNLLPDIIAQWRAVCAPQSFKPYGYATFFDLDENPDAPMVVGRGIRTGRNALIELWQRQQRQGVSHVALNLKTLRRPAIEVLQELAEYVLPLFPALESQHA